MSRVLALVFIGAASLVASGQAPPDLPRTLSGVVVERATYRGKPAIKVAEPKINAGGGIAVLNDLTFHNGDIDAEIAGVVAPGAAPDARGFVGLAFRVLQNPERYEAFYLRPTNGRAEDQVRRNHSAQYVSEPEFPWHRLRKESPEKYESYVDLEPAVWTRVRISVDGVKARLFVHGASQPTLIVNDLKLGDTRGGVGLWIGPGTEGYFSSVKVTPR